MVLQNVGLNGTRAGYLRIAQRMGAVILGDLEEPGAFAPEEPVGELDVAHAPLVGTEVGPDEVPAAIDELLPLRGGVIDARGDHRIAMLGAVAGLGSRDGVEVQGMDAAAISYPGFEADLKALIG